jgi:hypothetical protein
MVDWDKDHALAIAPMKGVVSGDTDQGAGGRFEALGSYFRQLSPERTSCNSLGF